ncbi:MAG: hypothetical protein HY867_10135 [Chloroflexi bacterium]|nr:hypothetical protein [Chloroflexota bacterium]
MPAPAALESHPPRCAPIWGMGFLLVLLSLIGLILYANPHGMFPWKFAKISPTISTFVPTAARTDKIALYNNLDFSPEVLILGSSRALTIPSARILENTGYRTFNMSVNGGGPLDFLTFGRFTLSKDEPPTVLIVELVYPSLKVPENPMPVSMLPYLETDKGLETADKIFHDVVSLQSISDTVYQFTYGLLSKRPPNMTYIADGTGIRVELTEKQYRSELERITKNVNQASKCAALDALAMGQLESLIELAAQKQVAVLFYRSPLNADYLDMAESDHPDFIRCEALFNTYMSDLLASHPNVFFRDLTYYETVGALRWDGYYDVHHLKPLAAQLVVDALTPDIQKAMEWAIDGNR